MKNLKSIQQLVVTVLLGMSAAMAGDAPPLQFTFKPIKVPGALQTFAAQINNAGKIVGTYQDKNKAYHGFVMKGNKVTRIDHPNATSTSVSGINPNRPMAIVGGYTKGGPAVGFVYRNGKFTDIHGPAGALDVSASGINDKGQIVGTFDDVSGVHGYLLNGGQYTTLDAPGSIGFTAANGINNQGKVVLFWQDVTLAVHASVYDGGVYTLIDVPGATGSEPFDLDSAGDVVYSWLDSGGLVHGALLHNATYYQLDFPTGQNTSARGINDKQTIVGEYQTTAGRNQSFKATYK